ncbi:hypothetical protein BDEG_25538 [Batrachochytrium dendrobatidis JEL423]|uniref:Retrovirus-related Pol polyprotein from transposon TNT 1-94-like beta-barrel domain-containing protein n=1 Tax=Batrachochytrium dendrobatidis (strain JEL423) TaxID=403673 RepID=A0A177WRP7_BATDL|nr:hypothetical protein BDEG_25538 [Batrachochytrium dendrobatidis JEL423]
MSPAGSHAVKITDGLYIPKLQNAEVALHSSFGQRKPPRAYYNNQSHFKGTDNKGNYSNDSNQDVHYNNQPHLRGFTNGDHSNDSNQNVQNSNNSSYWPNGKKKILCRNCGKLGSHLAKDCRARSSNNSQSNSNYASTSCANLNANNDFSFHNTTTSPKTDYCSISRNSVNEIILDSGATTHMVCNKNWLSNTVPLQNHSVKGSMKTATNAECKGSLQLKVWNGKASRVITINNVLYVPGFEVNLISPGKLAVEFGCWTKLNKQGAVLYTKDNVEVLRAHKVGTLDIIKCEILIPNKQIHASVRKSSLSGIKKPKANIKVVAESTQFISNEAINASSPRIQELSQPDSEVEDTPLKSKTQGPYYYYKRQPDFDYMNSSLVSANISNSTFPSNWKQAMTAPDANLWKIAADKETESMAPLFTHSYNLGGGITPSVPIVIDNVVSPETPEIPYRASTLTGGESKSGRRQVPIVVQTARNTARMTVADRGTNIKTSHGRITQEGLLGRAISKNKAIKTSLNKSSLAGYRKPNRKSRSKSQGSRKEVQERPVDVMNRDRATMAAPIKSTVTVEYPGAISETADASEPSIQAAVEQRMVENLPTNTSQEEHYLKNVLKRFYMLDCKPVATPIESGTNLTASLPTEPVTDAPYREAVGALMYAMVATRPDLGAAIGQVSRFMHHPNDTHWTAVKRILRYVKYSLNYSLTLGGDNTTLTSVAISTMEAEYAAAVTATQELLFLRNMLNELGFTQERATILYSDSQSAIANTENQAPNHATTKHMDVKLKFLRDQVSQKNILVMYIRTQDQIADIMTKGLPRIAFAQFSDLLGLRAVQGEEGC